MNLPLLDRVDALLREDAVDTFGPAILGAEALSLLRELRDAHEYAVKELFVTLERCHKYQEQIEDSATPTIPWPLLEDALKRANLVLFYDHEADCLSFRSTAVE